jgi:hypothetical protein
LDLDQRNATDLRGQAEETLHVELIRDRASSESVDAKIVEINSLPDQAVVPEFPPGMAGIVLALSAIILIYARMRKSDLYFL